MKRNIDLKADESQVEGPIVHIKTEDTPVQDTDADDDHFEDAQADQIAVEEIAVEPPFS